MRVWRWISFAARLALAVVWAWAGLAKISDPDVATRAVRAYELFPEALVKPIAWGLPFVELGLAVLLLIGLATRPAAWVSAVLFVAFIVMIGSAWARGLSIDCGCFGGGGVDQPLSMPPSTQRRSCATSCCSACHCSSHSARAHRSPSTRG